MYWFFINAWAEFTRVGRKKDADMAKYLLSEFAKWWIKNNKLAKGEDDMGTLDIFDKKVEVNFGQLIEVEMTVIFAKSIVYEQLKNFFFKYMVKFLNKWDNESYESVKDMWANIESQKEVYHEESWENLVETLENSS